VIIYLGSEVPSNRKILESGFVKDVGVSFWRLTRRGLPKNKSYLISNYFEPWMNVHVYPGLPKNHNLGVTEYEEFVADYEDFLANNMDRISSFMDFGDTLKPEGYTFPTPAFTDELDKYWAVVPDNTTYAAWLYAIEQGDLKHLVMPGGRIDSDPSVEAKIKGLINNTGVKVHALSYARPDALKNAPWASVSTMSWLSPMMHGETIVWDGNQIMRYPARMKEQARPRYKAICEQAGLDFEKILADDNVEVCRLALWSYEQFEKRFNMTSGNDNLFNNLPDMQVSTNAEITPIDVDNTPLEMRKLQPRRPDEMGNLPVFGVENKTVVEKGEDGRDIIKDVPVLTSNSTSLRQCNTCFVASNCPAFKPSSTCAFKLPVEVKTKDQLKALINTIIEMQGQRVAFARFSEEMNGGYPDPNLSQEIDRLFKLIKTVKELDDSSSFIKMTLEGRSAGAGVLSNIFGEKAKSLNDLPQALDAQAIDAVIEQQFE
jgi:hypothetical protein